MVNRQQTPFSVSLDTASINKLASALELDGGSTKRRLGSLKSSLCAGRARSREGLEPDKDIFSLAQSWAILFLPPPTPHKKSPQSYPVTAPCTQQRQGSDPAEGRRVTASPSFDEGHRFLQRCGAFGIWRQGLSFSSEMRFLAWTLLLSLTNIF